MHLKNNYDVLSIYQYIVTIKKQTIKNKSNKVMQESPPSTTTPEEMN